VADAIVDIEFVSGLGLPYVPGAEAAFGPTDAALFATVVAAAGAPLTLVPAFDLPIQELGDLMAAARQGGVEPPDLLAWYSVTCDESVAAAVAAAFQALPFVNTAEVRSKSSLAGWGVSTDPMTLAQAHLTAAPSGIDAFAAWQVPGAGGRGARVADIESSWDLHHADLENAGVAVLAPFSTNNQNDRDHGTGCLGIVGAWTNGLVSTGIAPWADLAVSNAPNGDWHAAILRAARHVGRGGIILIELGDTFILRVPPQADGPWENQSVIRIAITQAVALGALVVEPAGNGNVNLDTDPRVFLLRAVPESGALLVGAGDNTIPGGGTAETWTPADFTTHGSRVGCFAAGVNVAAPASAPAGALAFNFGGTSAAGAIVAGIAAAVQGMAIASPSQAPLSAADLRARLENPGFGTLATRPSTPPKRIGVMPDLSKLAAGLGVPRIPPVTAVRGDSGSVVIVRGRADDLSDVEIAEWHEDTASWTSAIASASFAATPLPQGPRTTGHPIAIYAKQRPAGVVVHAITPTELGCLNHRSLMPVIGLGFDQPWREITTPFDERFMISAPMTVAVTDNRLLAAGLSTLWESLVVVAEFKTGQFDLVPTTNSSGILTDHEPEFTWPGSGGERFDCPPVLASLGNAVALVGVDQFGWIRFAEWSPAGWSTMQGVEQGLDRSLPPALIADGLNLYVLGLDPTGNLREAVRSPSAELFPFQWSPLRTVATPPLVTWGVSIQPTGEIAAASDGAGTLMVIALDATGHPLFTVRLPGLDWTPLFFIPSLSTFVARGGLAVASPAAGVFIAAAADASGAIWAARWTVLGWMPFTRV
jgi:hypothetical protein